MATTIRVQATLTNDTGVPRDVAVNTWHFTTTESGESGIATDVGFMHAALESFYNSIEGLLSDGLSGATHFKSYNLVDAEPRVAILESTGSITPGASGQPLPGECAIALSYHAAGGSGVNVRRRRGRIFLGPLDISCLAIRTGDAAVLDTARGTIADAANTIFTDLALSNAAWCVFSPTTAGAQPWSSGALAAASFEVIGGYIDDGFDTIKSRGVDPFDRTTFSP